MVALSTLLDPTPHSQALHYLYGRHGGGVGEPQRLATQDAALAPTGSRLQHAFPESYLELGCGNKEMITNSQYRLDVERAGSWILGFAE